MERDLESIICTAKYCCLYEYDKASKIWHACETSGPLFLTKIRNYYKISCYYYLSSFKLEILN